MASAEDENGSRRRGRRERVPAPQEIGTLLREAREAQGVALAEVHDRTGVTWRHLEALESGDLRKFPDQASASIAVRRYADLVGLDAALLARGVALGLQSAEAIPEVRAKGRHAGALPARRAVSASGNGHLERHHGDSSHLRAFTTTAEGMRVAPRPTGAIVGGAGAPLDPRRHLRRRTPLGFRIAVWSIVVLLLAGGGVLAAYHYKRQWLADIHLIAQPKRPTAAPAHRPSPTKRPTRSTATTLAQPVKMTGFDPAQGAVDIAVQAADYTVVVACSGRSWVYATTPASQQPEVNQTLAAGASVQLQPASGRLQVKLGSVETTITVQIDGQTVPGWTYTPTAFPIVLNFTSVTS